MMFCGEHSDKITDTSDDRYEQMFATGKMRMRSTSRISVTPTVYQLPYPPIT